MSVCINQGLASYNIRTSLASDINHWNDTPLLLNSSVYCILYCNKPEGDYMPPSIYTCSRAHNPANSEPSCIKGISGTYTSKADHRFLSSFIHQVFQGTQLSPASEGRHSVLDRPSGRPTGSWRRSDPYASVNAGNSKTALFSPQSFRRKQLKFRNSKKNISSKAYIIC